MTNKLVVIINSLKVPKIKNILLYEMKFLVPNYSCLQNPWLWGYRPQIPVLSVLNWICWTPPEKNSRVRHWSGPFDQVSYFISLPVMRPDTEIQVSTVTGMPVNVGIHKDVNAFRFVLHRIQLFFNLFTIAHNRIPIWASWIQYTRCYKIGFNVTCFYYWSEHNTLNTNHSFIFYNRFRPFVKGPSSGRITITWTGKYTEV